MVKDFATELEEICKKANVPKKDKDMMIKYLEPFFKKTKVVEWYFSIGPLTPPMDNTLLDCFILTEKFLINCEYKKSIPLIHMMPLNEIVHISERSHEKNILVILHSESARGGITIVDLLKNRDELENFVNQIRYKLLELK